MKALTVHQPYAHLLLLPDGDPDAKRVENRHWKWVPSYRGPLLIHAGLSQSRIMPTRRLSDGVWIDELSGIHMDRLHFGKIIGQVTVVDAFKAGTGLRGELVIPGKMRTLYPWLINNKHVEGPVCIVVANPIRFERPVTMSGLQGFWDVDEKLVPEAVP